MVAGGAVVENDDVVGFDGEGGVVLGAEVIVDFAPENPFGMGSFGRLPRAAIGRPATFRTPLLIAEVWKGCEQ